MTAKDPLSEVQHRNEVLVERYRMMMLIVVMLAGLCLLNTLVNVYLVTRAPDVRYFAQNPQGGLAQILPLNVPNMSQTAVTQFAVDSVLAANSFDFKNFRRQLMSARTYFTPAGWKRYQEELDNNEVLQKVEKQFYVVSSSVTGAAVIEDEGEVLGSHYWNIQVPFVVRFSREGADKSFNMVARIKVVRVPNEVSPQGVGVTQFVAQQTT